MTPTQRAIYYGRPMSQPIHKSKGSADPTASIIVIAIIVLLVCLILWYEKRRSK